MEVAIQIDLSMMKHHPEVGKRANETSPHRIIQEGIMMRL